MLCPAMTGKQTLHKKTIEDCININNKKKKNDFFLIIFSKYQKIGILLEDLTLFLEITWEQKCLHISPANIMPEGSLRRPATRLYLTSDAEYVQFKIRSNKSLNSGTVTTNLHLQDAAITCCRFRERK